MADTRVEIESEVEHEHTNAGERVSSTRRSLGAPRVQRDLGPNAARAERRPPTRAEIAARQEAMSETRRPTKPVEIAREDKNPKAISVPDAEPTVCEKPRK